MKIRGPSFRDKGPKGAEKYQRSHARNVESREARRRHAEGYQKRRDGRTDEEQLVLLGQRPGESRKERARLTESRAA